MLSSALATSTTPTISTWMDSLSAGVLTLLQVPLVAILAHTGEHIGCQMAIMFWSALVTSTTPTASTWMDSQALGVLALLHLSVEAIRVHTGKSVSIYHCHNIIAKGSKLFPLQNMHEVWILMLIMWWHHSCDDYLGHNCNQMDHVWFFRTPLVL